MSAVLRRPSLAHLEDWRDALERGWSPSSAEPAEGARQLTAIASDARAFVDSRWDPEAAGPPILLPDGQEVQRLPSVTFVIWQGGFAGTLGLRWCPGSTELPPTCLGHFGYSVVPWRQGEGLATRAVQELRAWLPGVGLPFATAAVRASNPASVRVMEKAGAERTGATQEVPAFGDEPYNIWRLEADL